MMTRLAFCLLVCLQVALPCTGQVWRKEANYWYFGENAGLRFLPATPANTPVPVTGDSLIWAGEGTTTISDTNGSLLFYVGQHKDDGFDPHSSVFNKRHLVMQNGRRAIVGGSSSSQNGIAVRQPGSFRYYYVFSVAQLENSPSDGLGFYYTRIDMDTNGGDGMVDPAIRSVQIIPKADEKVTATLHANGRWIWVLTHVRATNRFCAVLLTDSGVQQPVFSSVGIMHKDPADPFGAEVSRGCMKLSPDGRKIGIAITQPIVQKHYAQILDFDKSTGIVSNPISIVKDSAIYFGMYGVEFSPDSKLVYFGDRQRFKIYQYDLRSNDSATIIQSEYALNSGSLFPTTLQLGIDGRLYYATDLAQPSIRYLRNPDLIGAAVGIDTIGIRLLPGTTANYGLTNVLTSTFDSTARFTSVRPLSLAGRLYPQPARDKVVLLLARPLAADAMLQITNLAGIVLQVQNLAAGAASATLDLGPYPAGLYMLRLNDGHQTAAWRLSKE
ncbi:T9SS type A sorting domain-containing protein [Nostoc sp. NIES-2111]